MPLRKRRKEALLQSSSDILGARPSIYSITKYLMSLTTELLSLYIANDGIGFKMTEQLG